MLIGVPKEIKSHEYRVGLTPSSVRELIAHAHEVWVEKSAGLGAGFSDADYTNVGATLVDSAGDIFTQADMIVKVKEPQASECTMLKPHQILFAYLHLAPDVKQTLALMKSKAICIAYETVTDSAGRLPLLAPMSEVAGRMAVQAGAQALEKSNHGRGVLLGGVPGVEPAQVVIIGGGVVGSNAARIAVGMRANVTILDQSLATLRHLDREFKGRVNLIYSTSDALETAVLSADLVIGAVLIPGATAPKLLKAEMLKRLKCGAVLVDVAIDQGGCFETSKPTTHDKPMYVVDGVVHYCVANMPGALARTSTCALNNATLPYVLHLADAGYPKALTRIPGFLNGLNVAKGHITCAQVAEAHNLPYLPPSNVI